MGLFKKKINSCLGVDIGSSGIKVVELKRERGEARLLTYGFTEHLNKVVPEGNWEDNADYTAQVLKKLVEQIGSISRKAVVSLPTFSVFSSVINLSNVNRKNINDLVQREARKVIPLPLEEIVLDWKVIPQNKDKEQVKIPQATTVKQDKNIKILLTGAPKTLVKKYVTIFKKANIALASLETETFSLIRSLCGSDPSTMMIIEVGSNTTDISIINQGIPMLNRSIDVGGLTITKAISANLDISLERAEQFKYDLGITALDSPDSAIPRTIIDTISPITNEVKHMLNLFENRDNQKVEKIILSGGSSLLPNLPNYLAKILNINVIIGNPWASISYPLDLEPILSEMGTKLGVAVGLAIRGIE